MRNKGGKILCWMWFFFCLKNAFGHITTWGMVCEADLEEVYRNRSIGWGLGKYFALFMIFGFIIDQGLNFLGLLPSWVILFIKTSDFGRRMLIDFTHLNMPEIEV